MASMGLPPAMPYVKSGRLRVIGVTSLKRSPLLPEAPTVAESGLPGYESAATIGVLARTGTPAAVVNLLHREMARYLHSPEGRERLLKAGIEAIGNTPAEFQKMYMAGFDVYARIIKAAGIQPE